MTGRQGADARDAQFRDRIAMRARYAVCKRSGSVLLACSSLLVLACLAGVASGRSLPRRVASLAIALLAVGIPFSIAREHTLVRGLLALGVVLVFMRVLDIARDSRDYPVAFRVLAMLSMFDLRRARRVESRFDASRLALTLVCIPVAIASFWLAFGAHPHVLRWILGAVGVYCMAEGANAQTEFVTRLAGIRIPPQHRVPALAVSVRDFWSRRWNLNIRDWLERHCHRPLAVRGFRVGGVLAAFGASTLLHFWFVFAPLGIAWAGVQAAFFVLQGALVCIEPLLRLDAWPTPLRRVWTIAAIGGTSPLFVEPFLRVIGGP